MTLLIVSIIIMLIGLAGVLLPFLPGVPLTWLGLFIFAYGTHFEVISGKAVLIFLALTVLSVLLEFALPLLGAKKYKASKYGIWGAAIGLFLGPIVFNVVGLVIGPFIGAVAGEYFAGHKKNALQSGTGTFIGFMVSLVLKMVLSLVMIGYFFVAMV